MGIALMSAARLVGAVPGFVEWLWPQSSARSGNGRLRTSANPHARARVGRGGKLPFGSTKPTHAGPHTAQPAIDTAAERCAPRPLRVLRVVDAQHAVAGAGRMVISGRMADVCAELDRLAAAEAMQSNAAQP